MDSPFQRKVTESFWGIHKYGYQPPEISQKMFKTFWALKIA